MELQKIPEFYTGSPVDTDDLKYMDEFIVHNQKSHIGVYRSGLTSPEHQEHITVGRRCMVEDALENILGSTKRQSKHHFLLGLCEILADVLPTESIWGELHERLETEEDDVAIIDTIVPHLRKRNREDILKDFDSLRPRLLALYRMTGGSPRLTVMLSAKDFLISGFT